MSGKPPRPDGLKKWGRKLRLQLALAPKAPWIPGPMRRSLALRLGGTMALAGLIVLLIISLFISTFIRDGLFETRVEKIIADASVRSASAQTRLDQTVANTAEEVQSVAHDLMSSIQESAAGAAAVGVLLLRSPSETSPFVINEIATSQMRSLITAQMREQVNKKNSLYWQSVQIPDNANGGAGQSGQKAPGIIVGSALNLPLAGNYEFYIVYTLAPEQSTLLLVQQVMALGLSTIVILLALMTWAILYRVLVPLRRTVRSAQSLAAGDLNARVVVDGEDEMASLGIAFNAMASSMQSQITQLAELSKLQQRFVSDVSHELRTPLTTIKIADDVIYDAREMLDPAARRSAELLHTQIERFESMLADLLEISRIDSGGVQMIFENADLCHLVENVVETHSELAKKVGCKINVHLPGHPCTAQIDSRRIERIVRNLLVNAIEHSEGNDIDIQVASTPKAVAVRVWDHGVGMPPEVVGRVFDRFFRADPARARTTGGTGLGLAISREDARLSGGDISVWAKENEGASFLLVLPRQIGEKIGTSPLPLIDEPAATLDTANTVNAIPDSPGLLGATSTPAPRQEMKTEIEGPLSETKAKDSRPHDLVTQGLEARLIDIDLREETSPSKPKENPEA